MRAARDGWRASLWMLDLNSLLTRLQIRWVSMLVYWEWIPQNTIKWRLLKKFLSGINSRPWTFWENGFLNIFIWGTFGTWGTEELICAALMDGGSVVQEYWSVTELFLCVIIVAVKMKLTPFYQPLLALLLVINPTGEQKMSFFFLFEMIE